jgi:hypothetical protein
VIVVTVVCFAVKIKRALGTHHGHRSLCRRLTPPKGSAQSALETDMLLIPKFERHLEMVLGAIARPAPTLTRLLGN